MTPPLISLVVAVASNGVIGQDGGLPWRIPADLRWFKAVTMGKPVVMGRKTWDSLPRKPLPGRRNIVVTRASAWAADGAERAGSLDAALALAADAREIAVIGGASIYAEALPRIGRLYWTEVQAAPKGDTLMPPFDRDAFDEVFRWPQPAAGVAPSFDWVVLDRRA